MKKLFIIILALVLALAFATGCGNANNSGASDNGAAEESLRRSASELDAFDIGDATLDDINTLDAEGSFRGSSRSIEDWESAAGQ